MEGALQGGGREQEGGEGRVADKAGGKGGVKARGEE